MSGKKKRQTTPDMDPALIVAAVRMAGTSLRQLSLKHGYNEYALKDVLRRRWPKGEQLIASAIGMEPSQIWPSRYPDEAKQRRKAPAGRVAA